MTTLDAFRQATLDDATAAADRLVTTADHDATDTVRAAREAAERVRDRAREEGREAARRHHLRASAEVRRQAREQVLRAHRQVREELRERAIAALLRDRDGEPYRRLCARLTAAARRQLGSHARVDEDPERGGVVGRRDRRRVDYRLPVLVDAVMQDLAVEDLLAGDHSAGPDAAATGARP